MRCCYNLAKECTRFSTSAEECIKCIIEEAEEMHPYKVHGNAETYSQYNEGWIDALNFIASRLGI